jgi:hypothetical protein
MADAMLSKKHESEDSRNKNRQKSQQTGKKESAKKKSVEKPPSPIIKAPSRTVLVESDVHVAHVEPEGSTKQTTSNLTLDDVMSFLKDMKKDQKYNVINTVINPIILIIIYIGIVAVQ